MKDLKPAEQIITELQRNIVMEWINTATSAHLRHLIEVAIANPQIKFRYLSYARQVLERKEKEEFESKTKIDEIRPKWTLERRLSAFGIVAGLLAIVYAIFAE